MIVVDSSTRQFTIPATDQIFGVEADAGSEVKYFQAPRYVGNNLDLAGSFLRINYRNPNGDKDSYLIQDVTVDDDKILFSWTLTPRVTAYKGEVKYVLCATGPDLKVAWHTTLGTGKVLEGLEPDDSHVEEETSDVVAQLVAMVNSQIEAVESAGAAQVAVVEAAVAAQMAEIEAKGKNVRDSIPEDYTALSEAVATLAPGIVCEAEGTAITLSDSSSQRLQGMRIFGKSTQDGVPSPAAPVEIVSVEQPNVIVGGKNLFNTNKCEIYNDVGANPSLGTAVVDGNTIVLTKTSVASFFYGMHIDVIPGETYTLSYLGGANNHGDNYVVYIYNDKPFGDTLTTLSTKVRAEKTITPVTPRIFVGLYASGSAEIGEKLVYTDVQLELGSVSTSFESGTANQILSIPRNLRGIPVTSGGNYTDATGQQWICDEVDLARGVYVQRADSVVFDGTQPWSLYSTTGSTNLRFRNETIASTVKGATGSNRAAEMMCSALPVRAADATYLRNDGISLELNKGLSVYCDSCAGDVNAWISYLSENPMTLQYVLAEPIETPLSETEIAAYHTLHTNKPHTTLLNSEGAHMAVEYVADTKLYIDNLIKNQ